HLFALNLAAGVAFHERIRVGAAMPIYFTSIGEGGESNGVASGDIRLHALVSILAPGKNGEGLGLGIAFVPFMDLPTGNTKKFLGQKTVAGGAKAAVTYEYKGLTVSGDIGMQFNPKIDIDNLNGSDALLAGVGIGYLATKNTGINL